jgi:replicative DNA helicase
LAPALRAAGRGEAIEAAEQELAGLLRSPELFERIDQVKHNAAAIDQAYQEFYRALHQERTERYARAVDGIKGRSEFLQLDPAGQEAVLQRLVRRVVEECDLPPFATVARNTGATLRELQADIEMLPALEASAIARMQEILARAAAGNARVVRVKLAAFFTGPRDPDKTEKQHIDAALERLREHLYGLLDEGVKIIWE